MVTAGAITACLPVAWLLAVSWPEAKLSRLVFQCARVPVVQANAITHMGQPALLYLVPLTLGSVALTAATRGDVQRILQFKDAPSNSK